MDTEDDPEEHEESYVCSICGKTAPWEPGWQWVGPVTNMRATCSEGCR